jgi:ferredoxin-type protein NapH
MLDFLRLNGQHVRFMKSKKKRIKGRSWVQFASLLALNSSFWGVGAKWICTPVLNCHSCSLAWFACPIGVFVHYAGYRIIPFLALGTVILVGALLGRLLCGWVCPFGYLQDLLYKIKSPKWRLPKWTNAIKYVLLAVFVFLLPFLLGAETLYSFCRLCPVAAIQATTPAWIAGDLTVSPLTIAKYAILALVLALAVFSNRSFCKLFCPIGALLAPFNHISFWKVKPPTDHCTSCSRCDKKCPTDVEPSVRIDQGLPANWALDCVTCHDCREACPLKKPPR